MSMQSTVSFSMKPTNIIQSSCPSVTVFELFRWLVFVSYGGEAREINAVVLVCPGCSLSVSWTSNTSPAPGSSSLLRRQSTRLVQRTDERLRTFDTAPPPSPSPSPWYPFRAHRVTEQLTSVSGRHGGGG